MSATEGRGPNGQRSSRLRRSRRRALAAAVGLALLLGVGVTSVRSVEPVEAAWSDAEATRATVSAGQVPSPSNLSCRMNGIISGLLTLLGSVTLTWHSSAPSPRSFVIGVVNGGNNSPTEANVVVPIQEVAGQPDTYQATIPINLLSSLIASLLGGSASIGVATTAGENWQSPWAEVRLQVALLGLLTGSSCTVK